MQPELDFLHILVELGPDASGSPELLLLVGDLGGQILGLDFERRELVAALGGQVLPQALVLGPGLLRQSPNLLHDLVEVGTMFLDINESVINFNMLNILLFYIYFSFI